MLTIIRPPLFGFHHSYMVLLWARVLPLVLLGLVVVDLFVDEVVFVVGMRGAS